jgi:hypothetical protein
MTKSPHFCSQIWRAGLCGLASLDRCDGVDDVLFFSCSERRRLAHEMFLITRREPSASSQSTS